jgi:hypothetical protein
MLRGNLAGRRGPLYLVLGVVLWSPCHAQFSGNPSFGSIVTRKKVQLQRKLPPVTNVKGKAITVKTAPAGGPASELQSTIENLLSRSDSGVRVEGNNPDILIDGKISQYEAPKYVTSGAGNNATTTLTGGMTVVFRITEPRTNHVLAAGVASSEISSPAKSNMLTGIFHPQTGKKYNTGEEADLVSDVARQVASYLVVTNENVQAMLATGKELENGVKLAESYLWTRALESWETAPKYPDAKLDAYRTYDIGVANEALAYQAENAQVAIRYLEEASSDYGKALNDNPGEKYFLEPQNRIKAALAHYTSAPGGTMGGTASRSVAATPAATEDSAEKPLSNDDVIAMAQAHVDESLMLDAIRSAHAVKFDLSVNGLITLSKGGVPGRVVTVMKDKQASSGAKPAPKNKL